MSPKISVIIPIYNTAIYIERCARSLFEQTFLDIEYLFIDDCSTDNSIEILYDIISEYPMRKEQVKIIRNEKNSGQAFSRKIGMINAMGDYIIHCDSDDWVAIQMYEKMYKYAVENDYDMVWCDYYRSDGITHRIVSQNCSVSQYSLVSAYLTALKSNLIGSLCNRLFKRELLTDNFIYPSTDMTEDLVMTLQIVLNSNRIGYLSEPLYYYFVNTQSICMSVEEKKIKRNLSDVITNNSIIFELLDKYGWSEKLEEQIICKKFSSKEVLIPLLNNFEYRSLWKDIYPEINNKIWINSYIPWISKIRAFLILNKMYFLYSFFKNCIKFYIKK